MESILSKSSSHKGLNKKIKLKRYEKQSTIVPKDKIESITNRDRYCARSVAVRVAGFSVKRWYNLFCL